jgi:hypothetical protein
MHWKTLNKVCLKQDLSNGLNMPKLLHETIEFQVTPQIAKLASMSFTYTNGVKCQILS